MKFRAICLTALGILATGSVFSVDFDCIPIGDYQSRPAECDDPSWPSYDPSWCNCLTTGLTASEGGKSAQIEQAIVEITGLPTYGKYQLDVPQGTLRLDKLVEGDKIGKLSIDVPISAEGFVLVFEFVVTLVDIDYAEFDVTLTNAINATTEGALTYNPVDSAHASGLTYRGNVTSFGPGHGFQLNYEFVDYINDVNQLPPGATSTGIEFGDLQAPGFSIPILSTFPTGKASFILPQDTPLLVTTTVDEIHPPDPSAPLERIFSDAFPITVSPIKFRRGDGNGDKTVDLSDVIFDLDYLFVGGATPGCLDAADANDDGKVDISDPLRILFSLFGLSEQLPAPGPSACGPDADTDDTLAACVYSC